jgi:hypothetical protein
MTDDEQVLEQIAAEARQLQPLSPSRDLWPDIAARIADTRPGVVPIHATGHGAPRFAGRTGQRARLALAATLLVAVSSAITWSIATQDRTVPADGGFASAVDDETATSLHLASLDASVNAMDEEIAALETIVRENRATLDPRTVTVLESSLKLIDAAIAESRAALAADPASQFLATQFTRAYTSKLTLLRDAATLPTGI